MVWLVGVWLAVRWVLWLVWGGVAGVGGVWGWGLGVGVGLWRWGWGCWSAPGSGGCGLDEQGEVAEVLQCVGVGACPGPVCW